MGRAKGEAINLTPKFVDAAKPADGQAEKSFYDASTNLVLRVVRSTKKPNEFTRYWLRVDHTNGRKKVPLGKCGDLSLADARKLAGKKYGATEMSAPESCEKDSEVPASSYTDILLHEAIGNYLTQTALRPTTIESCTPYQAFIQEDNDLKNITLGQITKKVARMIIDKKLKPAGVAVAPGAAKKLAYLCSSAYDHATELEDDVQGNPFKSVLGTKSFRREVKHEVKSGRSLSNEEIRHMWHTLNSPNGPGSPNTARALMLMLVTGLRSTEVTAMHRREILPPDPNGDVWWRLPPERIKTESIDKPVTEPHYIFLTPLMMRIIGDGDGFIFQNKADPTRPMYRKSATTMLQRDRGTGQGSKPQYLGLEAWTAQSMRVTVETHLRAWHVQPAYFNAMLNHAKTSLQKSYDKNTYAAGKKKTWLRWSSKIERLVGEDHANNIRHIDPPRYDIELLQKLVSSGETNTQIAKDFGVSEARIRALRKEHLITPPPRESVRNVRTKNSKAASGVPEAAS